MDSKIKKDSRNKSQNRNKGIKYAGENKASFKANLDAKLTFNKIQLGKTSTLSNSARNGSTSACKPAEYNLVSQSLSTSSEQFDGSTRASIQQTTGKCFDFTSEDSLKETLGSFDDEKQTAGPNLAKEVINGQGIDNDEQFRNTLNSANGLDNCMAVEMIPNTDDFSSTAKMKCNDSNPNFKKMFGSVTVNYDNRCEEKPEQQFIITGSSAAETNCGGRSITIDRTIKDCCGNISTIEHTIEVEKVPPTFTQEPNSLDLVRTCDFNMHPSNPELPRPSFARGCDASSIRMGYDDTVSVFNHLTCATTFTRRTTLTESNCDEFKQTFIQDIVLKNDYAPIFDSFPNDKTIGVFDSYGSDALGFPTAFQQCGLPVTITYSDMITIGDCFAERILKRTFKAVDSCGHSTEQIQTILISTQMESSLPLGNKSLAKVYANTDLKSYIDDFKEQQKDSCLIESANCGISGAISYECKTEDIDFEFGPYQNRLLQIPTINLNKGTTELECICPEGDSTCDSRVDISDNVLYVTPVTKASGNCTGSQFTTSLQRGTSVLQERECDTTRRFLEIDDQVLNDVDGNSSNLNDIDATSTKITKAPQSSKARKKTKAPKVNICAEKVLTGDNHVYNFFTIEVTEFANTTFIIDVPATSVVLVNVYVPPNNIGKNVYFGKYAQTKGVILRQGLTAHNVIWNIVNDVELKLDYKNVPFDWAFYGTVLNPYGKLYLKSDKYNPVVWMGQLFANDIHTHKYFQITCGGHFTAFAFCENITPPDVLPPSSVRGSDMSPYNITMTTLFIIQSFIVLAIGFWIFWILKKMRTTRKDEDVDDGVDQIGDKKEVVEAETKSMSEVETIVVVPSESSDKGSVLTDSVTTNYGADNGTVQTNSVTTNCGAAPDVQDFFDFFQGRSNRA